MTASTLQRRAREVRERANLERRIADDPADWRAVDALLDLLVEAGEWRRVVDVALAEMLRIDRAPGWDVRRARRLVALHNAGWDRLPEHERA